MSPSSAGRSCYLESKDGGSNPTSINDNKSNQWGRNASIRRKVDVGLQLMMTFIQNNCKFGTGMF